MKNRRVVKENWEGPFEEEAGQYAPNVSGEGFSFQSQAANGPSFLREGASSTASVSYDPPPSFLTWAPLGVPYEGTVDVKRRAEMPVTGQPEGAVDTVPLFRKALGQARQAPEKTKKRTGPSQKLVKPYEGNEENGFIHRWVYEEVRLSMSKMSIMSLVLGLLFLGTLFFIIGFLAAVATLKQDDGGHRSQSAWQASNTSPQGHPQGQVGGKLGVIAGSMGSSLVGGEVRKQLAPLGKVMGAASAVVPRPLQPFARYGTSSAHMEAQNVGKQVNPFAPRQRMRAPEQQQPYGGVQQQPSEMPQGYPVQGQPYGFPATPAQYQQPGAIPQGGQGYGQGYAAVQQQPMMMQQPVQQPYYQQPIQPMVAPHQMMAAQPQMIPQQQQMVMQQPYPQYPQQQMAPQGYYR